MKRFSATLGWRGGACLGALLLALGVAGSASAANTNLTATAKYSASSEWESDKGNTTFIAAKAFDGDITTRWNVHADDTAPGSWVAANWDAPVSINKVIVREFLDRVKGFRVQTRQAGSEEWEDAYIAEEDGWSKVKGGIPNNAVFSIRLGKSVQTAGLRILVTDVVSAATLWEVEAYNNPAGTLTGTIVDSAGKPIEGVTVRAGSDSTLTDTAGKYTLITDAGRYNVTAGKTGVFRDRIARGVELAADATVTQDFSLLPVPTNIARTATAVSYSDWQGGTDYDAPKANDGSLATRWNSEAGDAEGAYLEMQWPTAQTFNKVTIREFDDRIRNYSLQRYDKANDAYVDILKADVPKRGGDQTLTHILPEPVTSERVRLLVNTSDSTSISVYEMEVANAPVATAKVVVKDVASGNPVPNATITSDLGVILGTTDAQGAINLLVEPDDYVLSASAAGYFGGAPVAFTVNAGESKDVTLTAPAAGANIARTAKAVASSETEDGSGAPELANDGDLETYWLAAAYSNQWIAMTFDKPTKFTVVQLRGFRGVIGRSYLQILAEDGKTWVDVPNTVISPESGDGSGQKPADFFFPAGITTMGVRYYITATNSTDNIPGLSEFIIYDSPIPAP